MKDSHEKMCILNGFQCPKRMILNIGISWIYIRTKGVHHICTSLRRASSLKKSNSTLGETGSHREETADKITPRGSPGSFKFFLELILMSSPVLLVNLVHVWKLDAPTAWQKLHVILCANFRMLFLPANVATPRRKENDSIGNCNVIV